MALFWLLVAILIGYYLLKLLIRMWKYRQFNGPPSWLSLPILGHSWMLQPDMVKSLGEMHKKYGPEFVLDYGHFPTLITGQFDSMQEAYKLDVFNGRHFNMMKTFTNSMGTTSKGRLGSFTLNDGEEWLEQRKFMMNTLNELGVGKKDVLEEIIGEEIDAFCHLVEKDGSMKPITINHRLGPAINNIIWRMGTGKRTRQDDLELTKLTKDVVDFFDLITPSSMLSASQAYSLLFTKMCQTLGLKNIIDATGSVLKMIDKEIAMSSPVPDGSFIERFLYLSEKTIASSSFYGSDGKINLRQQLLELFFAGTDTTAALMEWAILYMIAYPDVQEKMFRSIEQNVGNCKPTLSDKKKLHYVQAFIDEVLRFWPLVSAPRRVKHDNNTYNGNVLPKNSLIMVNTHHIHMNPDNFDQPELFRPERYLDANGMYHHNEKLVSFGLGKRRCAGELLAQSELFLFTASMAQKYKFKACTEKVDFTPVMSLVPKPRPFQVKVEKRY